MAGFLGRFQKSVAGLVQGLLAPAEDPRQMFANAYERHHVSLLRVQQALADIAAAKHRLETKTTEVRRKLPRLEEQARRALLTDREDLARLALRRRQVAAVELRTLEEQVTEVEAEEQRLKLVEQRLSAQIEAFYARQEVLEARYSAAEAQVRINEALTGVSDELAGLGMAIEQAEAKTEDMQARASALDQLIDAGVLEVPSLAAASLEQDFLAGDIAQAVEKQLATLKGELAAGGRHSDKRRVPG